MKEHQRLMIVVAAAHTATIHAWQLQATREEREAIEGVLSNLIWLGHLAAFRVHPGGDAATPQTLIEELRLLFGASTVDACFATPPNRIAPSPAFLMPVWAFDHAADGAPASTGRLLGADLELIATPSHDEEQGAHLPGRIGRWLIHARPMF